MEEQVYCLDDGSELVLVESAKFNEKQYLLLSDDNSDSFYIGFEDNGKIIFLDENSSEYSSVFSILYDKVNSDLTN